MSNNLSFTDSVSFLIKDFGIESDAAFLWLAELSLFQNIAFHERRLVA